VRAIPAVEKHLRLYILPHLGADTEVADITPRKFLSFKHALGAPLRDGKFRGSAGDTMYPAGSSAYFRICRRLVRMRLHVCGSRLHDAVPDLARVEVGNRLIIFDLVHLAPARASAP
jgi:hypothetical protein